MNICGSFSLASERVPVTPAHSAQTDNDSDVIMLILSDIHLYLHIVHVINAIILL